MGVKLHRGFESRPLRFRWVDRRCSKRRGPESLPKWTPLESEACRRLDAAEPGQNLLDQLEWQSHAAKFVARRGACPKLH
jgi:hypothetical protein